MINETIQGDNTSASTVPTTATSDCVVELTGPGCVFLQCRVPGGEWINVNKASGASAVVTPDAAVEYRFKAQNVEIPARVYFGP